MPVIRLDQLQQFAAINVLSDPGVLGGPIVVPNCVQIVLNWTLSAGKTAHNVLYGRAAGVPAPTAAQAEAIRGAITTGAAWTALASGLATSAALASVSIRSVHTASQLPVFSTGAAVSGSNASIALPNEVALCVTLRTAVGGPSGRGRFYVPGWSEGIGTANNVVGATVVTNLTTWAAGFTSIFAGQGYTWVLGLPARAAYVGSTGTAHPARAASSVTIVQALCRNNTWDSQRRRGLK
jgi:hypothetical protein